MQNLWQDLRYGARMLLKNPGFTLIAVFTMALGIGANTAIFSVVNAILLRPLPFKEPDRVVMVWNNGAAAAGGDRTPLAVADLLDWRARQHTFEGIAAFNYASFNITGSETPERVLGVGVTANFFAVLGVQAALGRTFHPDEDRPGAGLVVLLSDGYWRSHFAADPGVVGRALTLNGDSYTVVGVMPPGLKFPHREVEMWAARQVETPTRRGPYFLNGVARLKPEVTVQQARADTRAIKSGFDGGNFDFNILPVNEYVVGEVRPAIPGQLPMIAYVIRVSPDYFRALGITLRGGRYFTAADTAGAPRVALINETMKRQFFPGEDPIGKRLNTGNEQQPVWNEIVGVVGDVKYNGLADKVQPAYYQPLAQAQSSGISLILKTDATDPLSLAAAVRDAVRSVDNEVPLALLTTMEQRLAYATAQPRFRTTLIALFAALALILSCIGIYGVISYSVAQRTYEIGIRLALGAEARDILRLVMQQGLKLTLIGVMLGLSGAFALTRLMKTLLFGVSATDPLTFVGVALLLVLVALLAGLIPARRATKVDPMVALRYE